MSCGRRYREAAGLVNQAPVDRGGQKSRHAMRRRMRATAVDWIH